MKKKLITAVLAVLTILCMSTRQKSRDIRRDLHSQIMLLSMSMNAA